jgi:2-oxoisovalerate dehydrogenase E2 component (dihydrolipoyl transacylase)
VAHGAAKAAGGLTQVTMPQLGESVTEGQISRWLKQPGDHVEKYEALVEVITDKVNAEVPAPMAGTIVEINVQEGETVAVGTLICTMSSGQGTDATEAALESTSAGAAAAIAETVGAPSGGGLPTPAPDAAVPAAQPAPPLSHTNGQPSRDRSGRASPAVRRLAEEHDLDISRIKGRGTGGRVTKRDVDEFLAGGGQGAVPAPAAPAPAVPAAAAATSAPAAPVAPPMTPPAPSPAPASLGAGDELIPLSPMRRAIAEHMVRSRQTSPHAWCATEVDMTGVVAVRSAEKERFKSREGVDLTYVPFVIKAVVESLKDHPEMNATWTAEGILRKKAINISVAVGLDDGLIVPVIHGADQLSISGLAHRLSDLATRAHAGKLTVQDVEGGTFCVNNPGTFGTVLSAPIINQPQAGIMTMEAIVKRPVALPGDDIGIRSMMFIGLSFDHRVLDGLQAASFLGEVKKNLEAIGPSTMIY